MPTDDYANSPNMSRSEEIIQSILDGTEYNEPARSRIEYLLKELKVAIEEGGGGGGGSYTAGDGLSISGNKISVIPATVETIGGVIIGEGLSFDANGAIKVNGLSEVQAKTVGMSAGGSNYIVVGGIPVYVSATAPTGNIPDGSIWIGG